MRCAAFLLTIPLACQTVSQSAQPPAVKTAETQQAEASSVCRHADFKREEQQIEGEAPEVSLRVTRVRPKQQAKTAVLLVHGAGSPSSAIWDLHHADYSFMRALACGGFDVFALDFHGFGGSSRPTGMKLPAEKQEPLVRAREVQSNLRSAFKWMRTQTSAERFALMGWSWGSLVSGMFASQNPRSLDALVLLAPVYDRKWSSRHITDTAWREEARALHTKYYNPELEEPEVFELFLGGMFPSSAESVRLPNGPYRDLYGPEAPIWDAEGVQVPTLVLRGESDRASLNKHARNLLRDLRQASSKSLVTLPGTDHFPFRRKQGYRFLQEAVLRFLRNTTEGDSRR